MTNVGRGVSNELFNKNPRENPSISAKTTSSLPQVKFTNGPVLMFILLVVSRRPIIRRRSGHVTNGAISLAKR